MAERRKVAQRQGPNYVPVPPRPWTDDEVALVRWYECKRKHRFDTFSDAEEEACRIMHERPVRNNGRNTLISAYECSWCDGFHVGGHRYSTAPQPPARRLQAARRKWAYCLERGLVTGG